jgi:hypothetical protein
MEKFNSYNLSSFALSTPGQIQSEEINYGLLIQHERRL